MDFMTQPPLQWSFSQWEALAGAQRVASGRGSGVSPPLCPSLSAGILVASMSLWSDGSHQHPHRAPALAGLQPQEGAMCPLVLVPLPALYSVTSPSFLSQESRFGVACVQPGISIRCSQ